MVNLFMTGKQCAPSKDAKNYDPSQQFGLHWEEGDFHELIAQIPEEFEYNHMDLKWLSFFRSHVKLSLSNESMKSTYQSLVHRWGGTSSAFGTEDVESGQNIDPFPILQK